MAEPLTATEISVRKQAIVGGMLNCVTHRDNQLLVKGSSVFVTVNSCVISMQLLKINIYKEFERLEDLLYVRLPKNIVDKVLMPQFGKETS